MTSSSRNDEASTTPGAHHAVVKLALRQKSDRSPPVWDWLLCLLNTSLGGIYLPVGPLLVLLLLRADRLRISPSGG